MYAIIRGAIMLNDANLLDLLLSEENVMDVVRLIPCQLRWTCHAVRAVSPSLEELRITPPLSGALLASALKMLSKAYTAVHRPLRFHGEA